MSCEFNVTRVVRMSAKAFHGAGGHRVEITIVEHGVRTAASERVVSVAFEGENAASMADRYAAATNAVDAEFHPKRTIADVLKSNFMERA